MAAIDYTRPEYVDAYGDGWPFVDVRDYHGEHDQQSHGNWADAKVGQGESSVREEAKRILARHDNRVVANLSRIRLLNGDDWRQAFDAQGVGGDTVGYTRNGLVSINTRWLGQGYKLADIIDHEMGHVAFDESTRKGEWLRAYNGDKSFARFNTQAKRNADEGFAETYKAFIQHNGKAPTPEYEEPFKIVKKIIASLPNKGSKRFHLEGQHDQLDHGNWAKGGDDGRPEGYFSGWNEKDREIVALGDKLAKLHDEPHLVNKIGHKLPERDVENLLASRKKTEGAALIKDGKLLHFFNGSEGSIRVPDGLNIEGMTLIHNHPIGGSLSKQDLIAASHDRLSEIRAVGKFDDATYSYSVKPDTAWPPKQAIEQAYQESYDLLLNAFADKRQRKGYTREQLNFAAAHSIMKATARKLGLKYEVQRWT